MCKLLIQAKFGAYKVGPFRDEEAAQQYAQAFLPAEIAWSYCYD